jgi:hypothetical protein
MAGNRPGPPERSDLVERPIFLVGAERSGTTLLALMLGHHGELAWGGEMQFLVDLIPSEGPHPPVDVYSQWLASDRGFQSSNLSIDRSLDFPALLDSFLVQEREKAGKPLVGATVHKRFDRLTRIWPDARFIHLVRDPRDVARSVIPMGWAGNTWVGAERWMEAERLWERVRSELPAERYFETSFEALLENPEQLLTTLCEFLELNYDPAMLEYPADTTYGIPQPETAYSWKKKARPEEVQLVEARIGEMLAERGYSPSGLPELALSARDIARLRRQDRSARVKFRINQLGLPLYVAELVTRRLKMNRLHRPLKLKVQAIVDGLLK